MRKFNQLLVGVTADGAILEHSPEEIMN
jgi:hypothetical protein